MKRFILFLAVALLCSSRRARAQDAWAGDDELSWQDDRARAEQEETDEGAYRQERGPTFDDFRDDRELSWAGEWIDTPEYGTVWRPTHVDSDWRPYLNGRWERTNLGWAWVSDEPFGWAVYHYGRWSYAGDAGWLWVPGRAWAPAWVSWRWGDGYAGWCPLGPRQVVYEQPAAWVFVGQAQFLEPVQQHAVAQGVSIAQYQGARALPIGRGPHAGPVVAAVQRSTGRTVRPLPISDGQSPSAVGASSSRVTVYRPHSAPLGPQARGAGPQGSASSGGQGVAGPGSHQRAGNGGVPQPHIYFGGVPSQGILDKHASPHARPMQGDDSGASPRDGGRGGAASPGGPRATPHEGGPHATPREGGPSAPPRQGGPHASPAPQREDAGPHAAPKAAQQSIPRAH